MSNIKFRCDKCLRENVWGDLYNGTYEGDNVYVYYCFNTYVANMELFKQLAEIIKAEYPHIQDRDMDIYFINHRESIRHAQFTTLQMRLPKEEVLKHLNEYRIL